MFVKMFTQILDSSLANDVNARHVFMDLLLLADAKGRVDMTPDSIARRTNIPIDQLMAGIAVLESADRNSRSPEHEGRRIIPLDNRGWGWQITNYEKYRDVRSDIDRRRISTTQNYGGYVYFLTDGSGVGDIKIGFSINPWARVKELASGSPNGCILMGHAQGGPDSEAAWHERFKSTRKNGEWFQRTPELVAAIEEACGSVATEITTKKYRSTTRAIQKQKQKKIQSTDKEADTDPKEEGAQTPAKAGSPSIKFINAWCNEYLIAFGQKYLFMGPKDGSAVKRLLATGITPEDAVTLAKRAWAGKGFNCGRAKSIATFVSALNEIRVELNGNKPQQQQINYSNGY